MSNGYEYALIHAPLEFKMTPLEFEALTDEQQGISFARPLGQVTDHLTRAITELPGGDWEAVSHDLMPFGASLMMTFLLRRQLPKRRRR